MPLIYLRDYDAHRPVSLNVIGFRSHGKTVFLSSLFHELDSASVYGSAKEWPGFSYSAVDQSGVKYIKEMQERLEKRELPEPTEEAFFNPVILRLTNVPQFGSCHLLAYDTSGEMLQQASKIKNHEGYISRVSTVMLLVSWKQKEKSEITPHHLNDLLTIYRQASAELDANLKEQNLLVVLTKGDRLFEDDDVPQAVREFLKPNFEMGEEEVFESGSEEHLQELSYLSEKIEEWLERHPKFSVFTREAAKEFKRVEYCIVTALGIEPVEEGRLACEIAPRGVLSALLWAMHIAYPDPNVEASHQALVRQLNGTLTSTKCMNFAKAHQLDKARERAGYWAFARCFLTAPIL